jgi:Major Facilitator Superfamily
MTEIQSDSITFHKHTTLIYSLYKLLGSPLEALFYLLAFILYKDLNASPLQITLLVSSKPAVALLSFYGNLFIKNKSSKLKLMIILSTVFGSFSCLLFPFINNIWFIIFAHGLFMMSLRATLPAWSEILKINLSSESRSKVFSRGSIVNYSTNIAMPLCVSPLLDSFPHIWKWLFFLFALLNFLNVFLVLNLKLKNHLTENDSYRPYQLNSLSSVLIDPWRNGWELIRKRSDFRKFQIVFMLCGAGLMVMQPILPVFFKENLHFTYMQLTLATSLCKGVSFSLSSPIWARWLSRIPISLFNFFICGFAALFSLLLIESQYLPLCFYFAYFMYGIMQAGSELSWNLSGPIFAKNNDSTLFTGINVAAVGVRGCIAPFLGELLLLNTNSPSIVFASGGILCLCASCYSLWLYLSTQDVLIANKE